MRGGALLGLEAVGGEGAFVVGFAGGVVGFVGGGVGFAGVDVVGMEMWLWLWREELMKLLRRRGMGIGGGIVAGVGEDWLWRGVGRVSPFWR